MTQTAERPLEGIRIIETASFLTGPLAGLILADLGADVIKVEPKGGDFFRKFGHRKEGWSAMWANTNRGKRSIELDLKDKDDLTVMKELLSTADVLLENWRPHVAKSLSLGHDDIEALNPRLIRLSINGFGTSGPMVRNPAFDPLIQGRTGLAALRYTEGRPEMASSDIVDKTVGVFGAQAILAALFQRERTGKGSNITLPMLDVMTYYNFPDIFQHRTFMDDANVRKARPSSAVATSDGHVIITPVTGAQISITLQALGIEHVKEELKQIPDYNQMIQQFYRRLEEVLMTNTTAHWVKIFDEMGVPGGPVMSPDEHLQDPQVVHNKLYTTIQSPVGAIRAVRYPATFGETMLTPDTPPPAIGEHSEEIRAELKNA